MPEPANQRNPDETELRPSHNREYFTKLNLLKLLLPVLFIVLVVKLWNLQVSEYQRYESMALNNKQQIIRLPAYRGEIFVDKGEKKVVENQKAFDIYILPNNVPRPWSERHKLAAQLEKDFNIQSNRVVAAIRKGRWNPYRPQVLKKNSDFQTILKLAEKLQDYPGVYYRDAPKRFYHEGEIYSHITGYIRNITPEQLRRKASQGYHSESVIGSKGIEGFYDLELRGRDGFRILDVDAKYRLIDEHTPLEGEPAAGNDLHLTIDSRMQEVMHRMMQGFVGGAILTRPASGEVLALYSYPSFDPNIFIGRLDIEKYRSYVENKDLPFFNRVIQAEYPPSSVYKLVVASALLGEDEVDFYRDRFFCHKSIQIGSQIFKNASYAGRKNLHDAIASSDNYFFIKTGIDMGSEKTIRYSKEIFQLGQRSGIDLMYERNGRVPTHQWKSEVKGNWWWDGDTANLSIGQGYMLSTIVQMNTVIGAIANDGKAKRPHMLEKVINVTDGKVLYKKQPETYVELPLEQDEVQKLQRGLRNVVVWGTARRGARSRLRIAGKTGTAQNVNGENHAWFSSYYPYKAQNPEDVLCLTVFVEHGGQGGSVAAPISAAMYEAIEYGGDPYFYYKRIMQAYTGHEAEYKAWLSRTGQGRLSSDYLNEYHQRLGEIRE